ncbi:hypothetical protein V8F20_004655 [Naviculisporaceae sp. PSN 640]
MTPPPSTTMNKAGYIGQGMEQIWDPNLLGFEIIYPCEWKTKPNTSPPTNKILPPDFGGVSSDISVKKRKKSFVGRNSIDEKRPALSCLSPPPLPALVPRNRRVHDQTPSRWICAGPKCRASNPGLESLFSDQSPDVEELCCSNPNCSLTLMDGMNDGSGNLKAVWDGRHTTVAINGPWDLPPRQECQAAGSCVCLTLKADEKENERAQKVGRRSLKDFPSWVPEGSGTSSKGFWALTSFWSSTPASGHRRIASASAGLSNSNSSSSASSASLKVPRRHSALIPGSVPA